MSSNEVTLIGSAIRSIEYIDGSAVITEGQDMSPPPTIAHRGDQWVITLEAGRKNSAAVANSFKEATGNDTVHRYAPDGGGDPASPKELNFYYAVRMTLQVGAHTATTTLYIGQGHYGTTNNWWIGGNAVLKLGSPVLAVIDNDQIVALLKLSGTHKSFVFEG